VRSVTINTTARCPYCDAAKRLLERKGVTHDEVDIES
jgi:glutaredoxin